MAPYGAPIAALYPAGAPPDFYVPWVRVTGAGSWSATTVFPWYTRALNQTWSGTHTVDVDGYTCLTSDEIIAADRFYNLYGVGYVVNREDLYWRYWIGQWERAYRDSAAGVLPRQQVAVLDQAPPDPDNPPVAPSRDGLVMRQADVDVYQVHKTIFDSGKVDAVFLAYEWSQHNQYYLGAAVPVDIDNGGLYLSAGNLALAKATGMSAPTWWAKQWENVYRQLPPPPSTTPPKPLPLPGAGTTAAKTPPKPAQAQGVSLTVPLIALGVAYALL